MNDERIGNEATSRDKRICDQTTNQTINAYTSYLIEGLRELPKGTIKIDIIVSFLQNSGLKLLSPLIHSALEKNIPVRFLTSTYMNITEPLALKKAVKLLGETNVYLFTGEAPSFHPKAYFFYNQNPEASCVFVGSSNISRTALTTGVEWNYRIDSACDPIAFARFSQEATVLFKSESILATEEIVQSYHTVYASIPQTIKRNLNAHFKKHKKKSKEYKIIENADDSLQVDNVANALPDLQSNYSPSDDILYSMYSPNVSQEEALFELAETREHGNVKALVVAATGVGKTFLAAFDSQSFKSVLFIAHRQEILEQAFATFKKVRPYAQLGKLYGNYADIDSEILFASVQSMHRALSQFTQSQFDYIVVDEFHHAVASSYVKVIDYFTPKFLLGLTATPHRMDKKNIFALCDYNLVYNADLLTAINRGWLSPFRYYGIYDHTVNYETIRYEHGSYNSIELELALAIESRADLIFKHYAKYASKRALGFCSTIKHAEFMAYYFNAQGIKAVTIHSGTNEANVIEREHGLHMLEEGKVQVVFSVDMLNEGVDIPSLDLLLFLRPTESPVVFLQQLGRGLRKSPLKNHVVVLDFIGNYKKVELIPFLLTGKNRNFEKQKFSAHELAELVLEPVLPFECTIDFDFQVVDIFKRLLTERIKGRDKIINLYKECKTSLGFVPLRLDFFLFLENDAYALIKSNVKYNPFRNYLNFLQNQAELEAINTSTNFLNSDAALFLNMIETTSMNQLYKLPIFLAFYNKGNFLTRIGKTEITKSFLQFYANERNRKDLVRNDATKNPDVLTADFYWNLARKNPIHFLCKTHNEIFRFNDNKMEILLNLNPYLNDPFFLQQIRDVIAFRRIEFIDVRLSK